MLPRTQRIHSSDEIVRVVRQGRKRATGAVSCSYMGKPGTLQRAAVIVGGKVSKKAVVRNLLRRRTYAILAARDSGLLWQGDLVVRFLPGSATVPYVQLQDELKRCLSQLTSER